MRTVVFNLKDAGNPDLRRRVAAGHIPPEALAQMSAEDMASDKRKARGRARMRAGAEPLDGRWAVQRAHACANRFK